MFFGKKDKLIYNKPVLKEIMSDMHNIFCGWYQIYSFNVEESYNWDEMMWSLDAEETISLVLINIGAYRDRSLDDYALQNISNILGFFSDNGRDIILRIAYDTEGKGYEREPSVFRRIEEHIKQFGDILKQYSHIIYIYQGLLVGNWGEMHGSRYLDEGRIMSLYLALDKVIPAGTYLAVRKPVYWRMLHTKEEFDNLIGRTYGQQSARIGLFNDAIMASDTDLGTYGVNSADSGRWLMPWPVSEELGFIDGLCSRVPSGGEAVAPAGKLPTLNESVAYLKKLHVSYLNCRHDKNILEHWKNQTWRSRDAWNGMNGYDYIGCHLGYRFCVRKVKVSFDNKEKKCILKISIENTGFAELITHSILTLIHIAPSGERKDIISSYDIRNLGSSKKTEVEFDIPMEAGKMYLNLTNKSDGREIKFATESSESGPGLYVGALQ